MRIDCKELLRIPGSHREIDEYVDLSDITLYDEKPLKEPVHVIGAIENRSGVICLKADIFVSLKTYCARCLKLLDIKRKFRLDELLVDELENEELDGDGYLILDNGVLDLYDEVINAVVLGIDMVFLCDEDCKGLCPICGADLNVEACSCAPAIDPRFAKLSALAEEMRKKGC